jgi:hypothetical protein
MKKEASRKSYSVYPFSKRRVLLPFERSFTAEECERVKLAACGASREFCFVT